MIDLDKLQANLNARMKNKNKNTTSPFFKCLITPAQDKSVKDLRDFRYEGLNQTTMKKRRVNGKTSYTRKEESR